MKKYFVVMSLLLALGGIVYQERINIASLYASFFVVDTATKGADAILMLSGNINSRVEKGIDLYKKNYAKQIWTTAALESKTQYPHILKSENVILAEILTYEKVDNLYILPSLKNGARNTFDEAYDLAHYLKNNPLDRIIIVTDGFHTLRAKIAFEKVFAKNHITTNLEFAPAFSEDFKLNNWFNYDKSLFRLLLQEPIGLLIYYFRQAVDIDL